MGQLTALGFATAEIKVRGTETLTVRGIALDDINKLLRIHGPSLVNVFERVVGDKQTSEDEFGALAILLFEQAPEIVADLIVVATDTPVGEQLEAHRVAMRLPMPVQVSAVTEIARLTFEEQGGLGEFMETLVRMFGGMGGLLANLRRLKAGSMVSDEQSVS